MLIPGLCSVTFRKLAPREIVELTRQAGLACIEWGGDVHVPPGDEARAREVGAMTSDAGLRNISYGSYYRPGPEEDLAAFDAVIAAAEGLGAINIRVWAGARDSADADAAYREAVAEALLDCAQRAEDEGMLVSLEYHAGGLTDTAVLTLELLQAVKQAGVRTYWQPPVGMPENQALKDLQELLPFLSHVHAFNWRKDGDEVQRLPLAAGAETWERYLTPVAALPGDRAVLLEFVKDDAPQQFLDDARALLEILREIGAPYHGPALEY